MAILLTAIMGVQREAARITCVNNLKQLVLASHNYHSVNSRFPPGFSTNTGAGVLMYLLPYIEEMPLYNQFPPSLRDGTGGDWFVQTGGLTPTGGLPNPNPATKKIKSFICPVSNNNLPSLLGTSMLPMVGGGDTSFNPYKVINFNPGSPEVKPTYGWKSVGGSSGGSGATVAITADATGAIASATVDSAGSGYPKSSSFLLYVGNGGGLVQVSTDATGAVTLGAASVVPGQGGSGYTSGGGQATAGTWTKTQPMDYTGIQTTASSTDPKLASFQDIYAKLTSDLNTIFTGPDPETEFLLCQQSPVRRRQCKFPGSSGGITNAVVAYAGGNTGYKLNDLLTLDPTNGKFTSGATLQVNGVSPDGAITNLNVASGGAYTTPPTNPVNVVGGSGINAKVNLTVPNVVSSAIVAYGGGYKVGDTLSVVLGSGSYPNPGRADADGADRDQRRCHRRYRDFPHGRYHRQSPR